MTHLRAAAVGILADRAVGEPPAVVHPVVAYGALMERLERHLHSDRYLAGIAHAAVGVTIAAVGGRLVRSTAVATWSAVAGRSLGDAARAVGDALRRDDLDRARLLLPTLVGRDPTGLDATQITRAVVESVAENTVDAVVAPALWAAVAGAPGALTHRAVNTMDAMVGYRDHRYRRYGWAAARLDDAAAWVPARVTALLVAVCRPARAFDVATVVRRDAPAHPSPNGGVAEAAFAAALGLRLGGESRYGNLTEVRPRLGHGRPAEPHDIERAVRLSTDVSLALAATLMGIGCAGAGFRAGTGRRPAFGSDRRPHPATLTPTSTSGENQ